MPGRNLPFGVKSGSDRGSEGEEWFRRPSEGEKLKVKGERLGFALLRNAFFLKSSPEATPKPAAG
jgi:hypothetical protein